MYREIENKLEKFYCQHPKKAVMLLGARQVGKTYSITKFAKNHYQAHILIDFVNDTTNIDLVKNIKSASDLMLRITAKYGEKLIPKNTLIIFDEIQEVPQIVKYIKYLVQEYPFDFVLTGSLLGVTLKDMTNFPVGFVTLWRMHPMSFKEFMINNGTKLSTFHQVSDSLKKLKPIDDFIHLHFLDMFKKYLISGGMPEVVKTYISTHNLAEVRGVQQSILDAYKTDISRYNTDKKLNLNEIYEAIPSELNNENKRFILKNLNEHARYDKYENSFFWLKNAAVVLPTYLCTDAKVPLKYTKKANLFKLYMSDVGLLTCSYGKITQQKILQEDDDINYGALYENVMAQMLAISYPELYYYNNKKNGEVDFLVETEEGLSAIEVKSGKDYYRHTALNNLLKSKMIKYATVACNSNIEKIDDVMYIPIYVFGFLEFNANSDNIDEDVYF